MIPALRCSGNAELGRQERDRGAVRAEQAEPCRGGVVASHTRLDPQRARREPQVNAGLQGITTSQCRALDCDESSRWQKC